jgi:hypothetical protein
VYVVVFNGATYTEPDVALRCTPKPLSIETDVAPVTFQESVAEPPATIEFGDATKEMTVGGGFVVGAVTVTVAMAVTLPPLSVAVRV